MSKLTSQPVHPAPLSRRMLIGGIIALACISFFLLTAGNADPSWPRFWWIRPLIVTPLAGVAGGVFYHFMDHLRFQGGWRKILGYVLGILGYVFVLWIGIILGLDGTMWD